MAINQTNFEKDKRLELKFDKQIKAVLGNYFITKDTNADLYEATDFLIYNVKNFKVGVRLRRFSYLKDYGNEFTIRWSRPSKVKTEIDKIKEGLVDFMLYGFIDEREENIIQYVLLDLKPLREELVQPKGIFLNNPPDSELAAFSLKDYPKNCILDFA